MQNPYNHFDVFPKTVADVSWVDILFLVVSVQIYQIQRFSVYLVYPAENIFTKFNGH